MPLGERLPTGPADNEIILLAVFQVAEGYPCHTLFFIIYFLDSIPKVKNKIHRILA